MAKNDISRMGAKIKKQDKQIKLLKKEIESYYEGSAQLSRALDSILAQVAIKWGDKKQDGCFEATLPLISVEKTCGEYVVQAFLGEEGSSYIIRVQPREQEENN